MSIMDFYERCVAYKLIKALGISSFECSAKSNNDSSFREERWI
jgi:hypothetical protein